MVVQESLSQWHGLRKTDPRGMSVGELVEPLPRGLHDWGNCRMAEMCLSEHPALIV